MGRRIGLQYPAPTVSRHEIERGPEEIQDVA
jgi:hypothetical protein